MSSPYVVAVDAGGTHTRVACFDLAGSLLSLATGRGGSPTHNDDAAANVAETVQRCLLDGKLAAVDAVGLAAGMAGVELPSSRDRSVDNSWATGYFDPAGFTCPRTVVNDAVTAHRGALAGQPGIIAVAGTGSIIVAVTDDGSVLHSGQFEHYAGGARHLAYHAVQLVLAGQAAEADAEFFGTVLDTWRVSDLSGLRAMLLAHGDLERNEVKRRYGDLAPAVTLAANTSPLADRAVTELARRTALGAALLAPLVGVDPVPVTATGSLAEDPAFARRFAAALAEISGHAVQLAAPVLDPLRGAALLAYDTLSLPVTDEMLERLATGHEELITA